MVQNQHDGGKIITHATVQGNTWSATVPAPGDYIVMFSALGHDCTSREFTVAVNDDQVKDAYLPPLFKNLDGTPSVHELPRAGLLVYSFLDKYINTEDDAPDDPPLNGVTWTIKFKKKDGTFGYVSGVTGTQPSITTLDGRVINDTAGYYYFTGLPPGEVIATSSASTAWQYDADGPLSLGPITDPVTRNPINFTSETRFYLVSTEEGGKAWDPKLYPGDPGTEAGVYLIWHGYIEKLDQVGTPTNPTPFNPLLVGSISGTLVDADAPNLDPDEPFPVPGKDHPGVELNDVVENGLVVLFRIGETVPVHPIATTETLADGSFS
ncbi:MAG: hypothetical protein ACE5F1_11185, partial [Planctomycetota bacterium]